MASGEIVEMATFPPVENPEMTFYSIAKTAELTGFSRETVQKQVAAGRLPSIMPNGNTKGARIRHSTLVEWCERLERESAARASATNGEVA